LKDCNDETIERTVYLASNPQIGITFEFPANITLVDGEEGCSHFVVLPELKSFRDLSDDIEDVRRRFITISIPQKSRERLVHKQLPKGKKWSQQ
jgi:hypothetical protein